MITYRDMTFCSRNECLNLKCHRNRFQIDRLEKPPELPVAWSDMKTEKCGYVNREGTEEWPLPE